jgi:hypothetical protein
MTAASTSRPNEEELLDCLRESLGKEVALVGRSTWDYCSSYPIEELKLQLDGARSQRVLFKDVSPAAMFDVARGAKMEFQRDPEREIAVYRHVLSEFGLSVPTLMAANVDPKRGRYWLFLQKVDGLPLWQIADFAVWESAATWLGEAHRRLAGVAANLADRARLLRYDGAACLRWLDIAGRHVDAAPDEDRRLAVHRLVALGETIARRIDALPVTFLHGEFYASNILVESQSNRIRPVDWEMAGLGHGLIDLAAIAAGNWTVDQREALTAAYCDAAQYPADRFAETFTWCRLYLAVQCLGWSPSWSPPEEHFLDWLGEATLLADQLGLP